jgi:uncharacterized membrane protein YbhN (UPF0104 family)
VTIGTVAAVVAGVVVAARVTWATRPVVAAWAALRLAATEAGTAVRRGWRAMAIGGFGYPTLQAVLLWLCLQAVGAHAGLAAVLLTYAVERLLTLVPLTPGGVGVVETGASAVLIGFGVDPGAAVAGFLLFRMFSYLAEIPLGGAVALWWLLSGTRRDRLATAGRSSL